LETKRPAQVSRMMESAICATISPRCTRDRPPPPAASPLRAGTSDGRVACSAGARPKSTPAITVTPKVKPSTVGLSRRSGRKLIAMGSEIRFANPIASDATSNPAAPARSENTRLSTSSCRTSCARDAPSARRIAISRARSFARARKRLETFTQATSRRSPTTVMITAESPTCADRNDGWMPASDCSTRRMPLLA
jgi:hypothetical protein